MKSLYTPRDPKEWQQFLDLLKQAAKEDKLDELISMLLTVDERNSLGLRVQIVRFLLTKECSQREIQQELNTSAATITRGSNMLKTVQPDVLQWVKNQLDGKEI